MNLSRHHVRRAHAHIEEVGNSLQAALTCLWLQKPDKADGFYEDAVAQLELAAKELGLRIEPAALPPEVSQLAQACHDILVKDAGFRP